MNRVDLQKLAIVRIREAKILFDSGEHSGAYYLAGYAVECALKACFAKGVQRYDFPEKDKVSKIFTHRLREIAKLAGLESDMNSAFAASATRW